MVVARSSANSPSRNGDVEATVSPDGEGTDGSVGTGYDCLNLDLGREGRPCSAGSDTQRSAGNDRPSKLERGRQDEAQELAASVIGKGPHQVARLLDDSALLPHRPVTALLDDKREKCIRASASDRAAKPVDIDQSLMRVWLR